MSGIASDPTFDRIAVILLAAGRGERFGGDKLSAPLAGRPLVHHAAGMLAALPFGTRIAVCGRTTPDLGPFGFRVVRPPAADLGLSASLAAGIAAIDPTAVDAVVIALADMPLVPPDHVRALVRRFDGDRIATRSAGRIMPPAVFGSAHFAALGALEGDRGAGRLLHDALFVELPPSSAVDIDSTAELARIERQIAFVE